MSSDRALAHSPHPVSVYKIETESVRNDLTVLHSMWELTESLCRIISETKIDGLKISHHFKHHLACFPNARCFYLGCMVLIKNI